MLQDFGSSQQNSLSESSKMLPQFLLYVLITLCLGTQTLKQWHVDFVVLFVVVAVCFISFKMFFRLMNRISIRSFKSQE